MENPNFVKEFAAELTCATGFVYDREVFHQVVVGKYYFDASLMECEAGHAIIRFDDGSTVEVIITGPFGGLHPHRYSLDVPGMNERARQTRNDAAGK